MSRINRTYKDRLFCFIFGGETNKSWTLDLYNAVNGSHYTDPREIEITTIRETVYMGMHNDVSFAIAGEMNLYEQQSTYNPNMPLRMLQNVSSLFEKYIQKNDLNKYSRSLLKLPVPKLAVFYIGTQNTPDDTTLRLSDSFSQPEKADIEVTVRMLNINAGHNQAIMAACQPLYEYSWLIQAVRTAIRERTEQEERTLEQAIEQALEKMPESFKIRQLLLENKAEVKDMLLTEYDEITHLRHVQEEARAEGEAIGIAKGEAIGITKGELLGKLKLICSLINKGKLSLADAIEDFGGSEKEFYEALKKEGLVLKTPHSR